MREVEPLARAREADIREPPLLLHLALVVERAGVREDALLEAGDEDDVELEALGGVERDERDRVGVAGVRVLVGHEGRLLEQAVERVGRLEVAVAADDLAQLEQVGPAVLALLRAVHEHGPVARLLEHRVEQLGERGQRRPAPRSRGERRHRRPRARSRARRGQLARSGHRRAEGGPDVAAACLRQRRAARPGERSRRGRAAAR